CDQRTIPGDHVDIRRGAEIGRSAHRQPRIELDCRHRTARADESGEDRRVVTEAGADMDDVLARLRGGARDQQGMIRRLAVVELTFGQDADQNVRIEVDGDHRLASAYTRRASARSATGPVPGIAPAAGKRRRSTRSRQIADAMRLAPTWRSEASRSRSTATRMGLPGQPSASGWR